MKNRGNCTHSEGESVNTDLFLFGIEVIYDWAMYDVRLKLALQNSPFDGCKTELSQSYIVQS